MARLVSLLAAAVIAVVLPSVAVAWSHLGTIGEEISAPAEVYILWDEIDDLGEGQFAATTLTVYPHTLAGIDLPDPDGELYYETRYPHRSFVAIEVYDCARRMSALIRTIYFSGERPIEEEKVLDLGEDNPFFMELLTDIPSDTLVFEAVCASPHWPE